jgi:putative Ca2+/H+ antiporter (TMEM165/GDT1 family)
MTAYRVSQVQLGTNSGLAIKTIRAILAGEPVAERSLAKLVRGLNAVPALRTVRRDHVPDD